MADFIPDFPARLYETTHRLTREVPSTVASQRFIKMLINLLFPIREKRNLSRAEIQVRWESLQNDFLDIISPLCQGMDCCCQNLTEKFFGEIPALYDQLLDDAAVFEQSDPAAHCVEEVILCYPGFYAVMVYRIAHIMYRLGIPILPRVITEYAHSRTGIDINPGAHIGAHFYIDHGTGIVIGETTIIGNNVKLYQGVTLGATFVTKELCGQQRPPDHRRQCHYLRREYHPGGKNRRGPRYDYRRKRLADRIGSSVFHGLPQTGSIHQRKPDVCLRFG